MVSFNCVHLQNATRRAELPSALIILSVTLQLTNPLWAVQRDNFRPVFLEGEIVDGVSIGSFIGGYPASVLPGFALNDSGDVVIEARVPGGFGVFASRDGGKDLLAKSRDSAPGPFGDQFFNRFSSSHITSDGEVIFVSDIGPPNPGIQNPNSIWRSASAGLLSPIIYPGLDVPDRAATFSEVSTFWRMRATDSGKAAFALREQGAGVTSLNDESLWVHDEAGLTRIAREGETPPGTSANYTQSKYSPAFSDFFITDSGFVSFESDLTGSPHQGVFGGVSSLDVAAIAVQGDSASAPVASSLGNFIALIDGNRHGNLVFRAGINSPPVASNSAVWSNDGGSLHAIALSGQNHPEMGIGETYGNLGRNMIGDGNHIVFEARLEGPNVTQSSDDTLWFVDDSSVQLIVREGSPIEGLPGVMFQSLAGGAVIGPQGHVLVAGSITDSSLGSTTGDALFVFEKNLGMTEVVRKGDILALSPVDSREVTAVYTGLINENGQVAVKLELDHSTDSVLMANLNSIVGLPERSADSAEVGLPDDVSDPTRMVLPGDANQDLRFDQRDLVQVQIAGKYRSGESASWAEGDWNGAPAIGFGPGKPPNGNGRFDQMDIVEALQTATYLTGPYGAVQANGTTGDSQTSIIYNAGTGEVAVDAPSGVELTSINIDSESGIFTGEAAANLGGSFDNDADANIFKATFGSSFGSLSFGNVAQTGLSEEFVFGDLSVIGSLAGGGDLGSVDLIYVPEPASALLLAVGLVIGLNRIRRGKH